MGVPETIRITPGVIDAAARVCYERAMVIIGGCKPWDELPEDLREEQRARVRALLDAVVEATRG